MSDSKKTNTNIVGQQDNVDNIDNVTAEKIVVAKKPHAPIAHDEYVNIASDLMDKHTLFYTFWELGKIIFSEQVPTAAVTFTKDGEHINFLFNPDFWDSLDDYSRRFIICHECLHVALNHGTRMRNIRRKIDGLDKLVEDLRKDINKTEKKKIEEYLNEMLGIKQKQEVLNIAMDITVNSLLNNKFGFNRFKVKDGEKLCWVDTVFKDEKVRDDMNFEFYYNKIVDKQQKENGGKPIKFDVQLADDHDGLGGQGISVPDMRNGNQQDDQDKFMKKMNKMMSGEDKQDLKDVVDKHFDKNGNDGTDPATPSSPAGTGAGKQVWTFPANNKKAKKKWSSIIKAWAIKNKSEFGSDEQWARVHRRTQFLQSQSNLCLPTEMDDYGDDKEKVKVFMYLDFSGSCSSLESRFVEVAQSIPRKLFDVDLFTFDTRVHPVINGQFVGGGGTAFDIIEGSIQAKLKEYRKTKKGVKYPLIYIMTDGDGTPVNPQHPENWFWIMPKDNTCTRYVNMNRSKVFVLDDFEG
jgi:hypothetical protein